MNLNNQKGIATAFSHQWNMFKAAVDLRLPVIAKLTDAQRQAWIDGKKDPIIEQARVVYEYLKGVFNGNV